MFAFLGQEIPALRVLEKDLSRFELILEEARKTLQG